MLANADTLDAWLSCETQWRVVAGLGGVSWLGLDYSGVNVVLDRLGFTSPKQVFADLQIMEGTALATFGERDR